MTDYSTNIGFWEYVGIKKGTKGFWKKNNKLQHHNIKKWCEWFSKKFNIQYPLGWYTVIGKQIEDNEGNGFFTASAKNSVNQSVYQLMMFIYPEYDWKPYNFKCAPQGFWDKFENRLNWFNDFRKENNLIEDSSLYSLKTTSFSDCVGCLNFYNGSILKMLESLVPSQTWYPWRLDGQVPKNYWNKREHIAYWLNIELSQEFNLIDISGNYIYNNMYNLTQKIICNNYGSGIIIKKFNGSVIALLQFIFPVYNWQFWKFVSAPNGAWDDNDNVKKYIKEEFDITEPLHLYEYNISNFNSSITSRFDTMLSLGTAVFPGFNWDINKFKTYGYSLLAIRFLDKLSKLSGFSIQHAKNGGEYKIPETRFSADGYIHSLNLIIEFHGCYYHGCPLCYQDQQRQIQPKNLNDTHENNYERTKIRSSIIRNKGYNIIEIWECQINKPDDYWTNFLENFNLVT